tara:strand:- start:2544 stop:2810 length:267 start_codon:yes stop_codon:yes gene_type:complete
MEVYNHTHGDLEIDFHYDYQAGEPEVWTEANGDPGTPGTGPSITFHKAMLVLADIHEHKVTVDISPLLHEMIDLDMEVVEDNIIESKR